tara:strand:- start:115 stop:603 length:489 start_codon:yes stop_codon:yes gene_type:complete
MLKNPRSFLNEHALNRVLYLGAIILCVTLLASHPKEYERFSNDRWTIVFHKRDTLALQAKYCPNRRIRENSALYFFRKANKDKNIVVLDEDSISSQLLRKTSFATPEHRLKVEKRVLEDLSDSGLLYRSFPVFSDSEESLNNANEIFLFFENRSERWIFVAL